MTLILTVYALLLSIDQLSKYYIGKLIFPGQSVPVIKDVFQLTLVHNPGGAFGLFRRAGPLFFIVVSIVTIILIFVFQGALSRKGLFWRLSIGLILGGASGNLIDRLRLGYVVDFLDFSLRGYHWPAFNFADLGITIGVIILSYKMFTVRRDTV